MADDVFGIVGTKQAGHFQVEKAVAEGGFAVVYRAHHDAFRAPVALKCLKVPATMAGEKKETFLEKFREEAELLFRLSAVIPAIVRPLQVGTLDVGTRFVPFLALEWLEGESFEVIRDNRKRAGEEPLAIRKLVKMLAGVAEALDQAHRFPTPTGPIAVVHCDLKPDNLYRSTTGGVVTTKILDFGIARVKSASSAAVGKSSGGTTMNAFTPQYGAPEQWQPEKYGQTGPWTDVYGLAISMVDMLAGGPPIDGSIAQMLFAALNESRRPTPRIAGVTVADAVERTFQRALAVDPKKRTPSVEAFWTELELALDLKPSMKRLDARAEKGDSAPPPPGAMELPSLEIPALTPPPVPKPTAPLSHSVRVVDPVDLAAQERQMSFGLTMQPPSRPRPPVPSLPHVPFHAIRGLEQSPQTSFGAKLVAPIWLLAIAMTVMAADQILFRITGAGLPIAPLRPLWIAGPLVGLASLIAFVRLLASS